MRHSATYRGKRVLLEFADGAPCTGRAIQRMIISPAVMRAKGVL